jgi:excisionase family DNA binding protein
MNMREKDRKSVQSELKGMEDMRSEEEGYVSMPLLTVGEAARYLGVSRSTLYQLIEFGEIKAVKMKGTTLIEEESLDNFRASGKLT